MHTSHTLKTRARSRLVRCVTLAACALLAHAQPPGAAPDSGKNTPPAAQAVIVRIAALDAKGHAVTDLTGADFQIFDDGKLQSIASFRATAADAPPPTTVILFDLLNWARGESGDETALIIRALEPLQSGDSVYVDLLTKHGDLYPVRALAGRSPRTGAARADELPAGTPWTRQIHPLLDQALKNVEGLTPKDEQDPGVRANMTFRALDQLGQRLTAIPGPKTIVWITAGVENWIVYRYGCRDIRFAEGSGTYLAGQCTDVCMVNRSKCIDYAPFFRYFSAALNRTGITVYSVEETPGNTLPAPARGTEDDTVRQLTDLTGGRVYTGPEAGKAIAQSLEDARARYQLAYAAPPPDGNFHKLRVACTRPGVRIVARTGYFADPPSRP